ncbi:MAG: hypothetical protein ACO27C_05385, partial [Candidatus Limnocylindrus sp.]
MSTVTFEGVSKKYGEVLAVDRLNLEIRDGEFMDRQSGQTQAKRSHLRLSSFDDFWWGACSSQSAVDITRA